MWRGGECPNAPRSVCDGAVQQRTGKESKNSTHDRAASFYHTNSCNFDCCFSAGRHLVTIRVTGQANSKSSGKYVDVDALVVE